MSTASRLLTGFEPETHRNSQNDVGLLVLASIGREHEDLVHGHVRDPDVVLRVDGDLHQG